jgi:hypothetical protein
MRKFEEQYFHHYIIPISIAEEALIAKNLACKCDRFSPLHRGIYIRNPFMLMIVLNDSELSV